MHIPGGTRVLLRVALLSTLLAASAIGTAQTSDATTTPEARSTGIQYSESRLASQRALFRQTRELLRKGNVAAAADGMAALVDYPLYPYLELQRLTIRLGEGGNVDLDDPVVTGTQPADVDGANADENEIDSFLRRHAGSVVADRLRNNWLAILAHDGRWREYLDYYNAVGIAKTTPSKLQQCWNLEALYRTQQFDLALRQTGDLWLETNLPDACDEPFRRWLDSNQRNEQLVWQRMMLALERKQETLARFLVVNIREPYRLSAEYALLLYRDPTALANLLPRLSGQPEAGAVITMTLKLLAKRNPDDATALWQQLRAEGHITAEQSHAVRSELGRQQVARRGIDALPWLLQYDPDGEDSYLLEWRVRLALADGDWPRIAQWIEKMPAELARTPRWTYWYARALSEQDDAQLRERATAILRELASERGYFGFRAADQLRIPYHLNNQPLPGRAGPLPIESPALWRAHEFLALNELSQARREWLNAMRDMTAEQQQNAALIAESWGWHDRAIQTASLARAWDDLELRFPLAYRDLMRQAARDTALPTHWLYAIARQESTFMPDARSSPGAIGLMQLMPDTAKQVARGLKTKVTPADLQQPATNIRLGSTYLSQMLARYSGNRVLATAAYNAGPGRVSGILRKQQRALPSDVWIELLPYKETRDYVQNVLSFSVIYARKLGMEKPLVESNENFIVGTGQ